MAKIHVVYNGRNEDLDFETLFPQERFANIGIPAGTVPSVSALTSEQVKTALAQHFDVGLGEFADHFVEMNPNGNITVRPNTVFGAC
jgi:hypothetical protein